MNELKMVKTVLADFTFDQSSEAEITPNVISDPQRRKSILGLQNSAVDWGSDRKIRRDTEINDRTLPCMIYLIFLEKISTTFVPIFLS